MKNLRSLSKAIQQDTLMFVGAGLVAVRDGFVMIYNNSYQSARRATTRVAPKNIEVSANSAEQILLSKISLFIFLLLFIGTAFASTLPSTSVRFYSPFEEPVDGQTKLVLNKILKGECHQHSTMDHRSDAWQCQAGKQTFEPCFIKTFVKLKMALCPVSPWKSEAVVIDFKEQAVPPKNKDTAQDTLDMSMDDPWAIALTNGAHCGKITSDTTAANTSSRFSVNGQHVKYACDDNTFLLGHIQRCELIWKILLLPSRDSSNLEMTEIATAWY